MTNKTKLSRNKKILFMAVTFIITFSICFIIAEIAVRILDPQSNLRRRDLFFRYGPFTGVEGIPNKKGVFATKSFKTTVKLNNEGFRDGYHDKINTENKLRIITLGDSFTWGHGVDNDEIYMKVLEKLDSNIETINMGGPGGDPPTSLKLYISQGLYYEHDMVLLGFFIGNDIVAYYPKDNNSPPQWGYDSNGNFALIGKMKSLEEVNKIRITSEEKYSPTKKRDLRGRIHYWFVSRLHLLTFIDNYRDYYSNVLKGSILYTKMLRFFGKENKGAYGFLNYCRKNDPEEVKYGWKLLADTLKTLKEYTGQVGATLYLVFIPQNIQISNVLYERSTRKYGHDPSEFEPDKPNRKLSKLCEDIGVPYLDLLPAMREETSKGHQLYFTRDGHWNAEGHRFAAKEIYRDLMEKGWLLK